MLTWSKRIVIVLLVVIFVAVVLLGKSKIESTLADNAEISKELLEEQKLLNAKSEKLSKAIYKDIPGIVTWGDSLTAGKYPTFLQNLITKNIYEISVENMGVGGEDTNTIMGRAGSVPFVVDAFTIPSDLSKVNINFKSKNGNPVAPLRQQDRGMNPVTINGVEGTISIEQDSSTSEEFTYYFQRSVEGKSVKVKEGKVIETISFTQFDNYIPIVWMGQNGGYENSQDLINQVNSIIKMDKYNDKFLVLGLSSGTLDYRSELEYFMEAEWKDRYINLREILSTNGLELADIKPTNKDLEAMESGSVPPSLLSDQVHFNEIGQEVIADIVFERMQELGYFDNVIELSNEIKSLK